MYNTTQPDRGKMTEKKEDEKAAPQPAKRTWTEWIVDISVIFSLGLMASTANAPVSIAMRSLFVRLGIDPNSICAVSLRHTDRDQHHLAVHRRPRPALRHHRGLQLGRIGDCLVERETGIVRYLGCVADLDRRSRRPFRAAPGIFAGREQEQEQEKTGIINSRASL